MTAPEPFVLTDEQRVLQATVRDLLAARATSGRVREVMAGHLGVDEELWRELGDLGLLGLTIQQTHGGAGASFVDLAIVVEEVGRRVVPVPLLSSVVLGAGVLQAAGNAQQRAAHLPAVAQGKTRLALAHLDAVGRMGAPPGVRAIPEPDGGWRLDGEAGYVVDGHSAHLVVTFATTDEGPAGFLVEGHADGLERTRLSELDLTRPLAALRFRSVRVAEAMRLPDARGAVDAALTAGAVALACEQVGGTQAVLDAATAYAKQRIQFGRPIGSFQAVKHRLAETLVRLEAARSAAAYAARVVARGDREELAIAAPVAASYCSEVYERAAADAIQVHGGIAFSWEHDLHLYLKRAKASKLLLGDPQHHRAALGDALGL